MSIDSVPFSRGTKSPTGPPLQLRFASARACFASIAPGSPRLRDVADRSVLTSSADSRVRWPAGVTSQSPCADIVVSGSADSKRASRSP